MLLLILWCQAQAGQQRPRNMFRQVQAVLDDGLPLLNVSFDWQLIIKGGVIVLAVLLDKLRTHGRAA
jgi:ribose/xylose/arabinose/galactoside ABC-type transport system permease subunit